MRPLALVLAFAASAPLLVAHPAAADPTKQACAQAYVDAQVARKEGRLRDARSKLQACGDPACPAALRRDCTRWLPEVEATLPSLAVRVVDADGASVPSAQVTVDGQPFTGPAAVDPGERVVVVQAPGMLEAQTRVELAAGDGRRDVVVRLERPKPAVGAPPTAAEPAAATPARGVPVAPVVLGAIGLVGLGAFAVLGSLGNGKKADLDASHCKPSCSADDVGTIKTMYVGADVSLGVGAASLLGAAIALTIELTKGTSSTPPAAFVLRPGGGAFAAHF
jgi:hypothetical protein